MRASIDTNVLVSYLLAPQKHSIPRAIVWAALDGTFDVAISAQTIDELVRVTRDNAYLASRIDPDLVEELITIFRETDSDVANPSPARIAAVRDPGDEYLIDHAIVARVDYLVTGDRDLLEFEHDFGFRIVTPAEFVTILEQQNGA